MKGIDKMKMKALPSKLRITLIEDDILNGVCDAPTKCMYAMAIRRIYPQASYVKVNPNGLTITANGKYYRYQIPTKAAKFLLEFDEGKIHNPEDVFMTANLVEVKTANVPRVATESERKLHRENSAKLRAEPGYKRVDTLRKRIKFK